MAEVESGLFRNNGDRLTSADYGRILQWRAAGLTFREIGAVCGVTAGRGQQLYQRALRWRERTKRNLLPLPTRPIDMGGERDVWHVWTPEMQAKELGL